MNATSARCLISFEPRGQVNPGYLGLSAELLLVHARLLRLASPLPRLLFRASPFLPAPFPQRFVGPRGDALYLSLFSFPYFYGRPRVTRRSARRSREGSPLRSEVYVISDWPVVGLRVGARRDRLLGPDEVLVACFFESNEFGAPMRAEMLADWARVLLRDYSNRVRCEWALMRDSWPMGRFRGISFRRGMNYFCRFLANSLEGSFKLEIFISRRKVVKRGRCCFENLQRAAWVSSAIIGDFV